MNKQYSNNIKQAYTRRAEPGLSAHRPSQGRVHLQNSEVSIQNSEVSEYFPLNKYVDLYAT